MRSTPGTPAAARLAMSLMRHSDRRLTDKVYTDENLLGTWGAIDSLPHYANQASQLASQNLGAGGQNVSPRVATSDGEKAKETLANIGASHDLAQCVATGRLAGNGGSGGARTRLKSNNDGPATALPSQIASQNSVSLGPDLAKVVAAWAKLPAPLKAAIMAIVGSANGSEGQP